LTTPPEQLAAPQDVALGAKAHEVLVPSHRLPQVPAAQAARPLRGVWFAARVVHFPIEPDRSQAWQAPPHARSQQVPSTQFPEVHCPADVHVLPFATFPHEPATQGCPWQSASVVHVVAHAVPSALHLKGAHATAGVGLQVPRPSQVDPVTDIWVVALQAPPAHASPLA
jgi:hypothetical protein